MPRLVFVLLLAVSCLRAASFTFTSCSAGTITLSPCNSDLALVSGGLVGPQYTVRAYAEAPSPLFANGAQLSAFATAESQLLGPVGFIPLSAIADATDSLMYQSTGPARLGFIQFNVALGYPHQDYPGAATAMLTDGVHQYNFIAGGGINGPIAPLHCAIEDCEYVGMLPFDLGSSFTAAASVMAETNGGSDSTVSFKLLEADGVTTAAFFATPEPIASGLQIVGLSFIGCFLWRRNLK